VARLSLTSLLALAACWCAAATAAAACPNASLTPTAANAEQVRVAVLCLIDQERASHGEATLRPSWQLASAAQGHSREMAAEDYFAHIAPDGQTPLDRIRATGYLAEAGGYAVGENIAWGTLWLATPQAIVSAWMASPEHRANILDATYQETGVGVEPHAPAALAEGQAGALYTQDFGSVLAAGHAARRAGTHAGRGRRPPRAAHHRRRRRRRRHRRRRVHRRRRRQRR
jgi:uncharacterized protein YkwD